jgi:hypothetical protein
MEPFQFLLTGIDQECDTEFLLLNLIFISTPALILRASYETAVGPTNCRFAE